MPEPIVICDEYDPMIGLSWSSDGRRLAGMTVGSRIVVWDADSRQVVLDVKEAPLERVQGRKLMSVALAGHALFAGYEDCVLKMDLARKAWTCFAEVGGVLSLSPLGGALLIGRAHVADTKTGTIETIREYANATAVGMIDDEILLTAFYDPEDNLTLNVYGHYEVTGAASTRYVSQTNLKKGTMAGDDVGRERVLAYLTPFAQVIGTANQSRCFAREKGEGATPIEAWHGERGRRWRKHEAPLRGEAMTLSHDGSLLAVLNEGALELWGPVTMTRILELAPPPSTASPVSKSKQNRYLSVALSPEGRWVALGDKAGKVVVLDALAS